MDNQMIFLSLLVLHVIGDYYLQTDGMSKRKRGNARYTLRHSLIYGIPFLLLFIMYRNAALIAATAVLVHGLIDQIKCLVERKRDQGIFRWATLRNSYLTDQLLHILSLFVMAYYMRTAAELRFFSVEASLTAVKWILSALLILKPVNITFKMLFSRFSPKEDKPLSIHGAGAVIGSLERVLMLIFLVLGQYASIGLIMTAKSIERYDKISKDPVFAEYYLIGTLFSILMTLLVYLVVIGIPISI